MGAKQLSYSDEARQKLLAGVSKLARAVKSTLGPRGRNAVLDKGWGSPNVTKDGVTVAEEIELEDPYENMGAQLVKEAASKTSDVAGDGTTTATILAEGIYREGIKNIASGADPMALTRGIQKAVDKVVDELHRPSATVRVHHHENAAAGILEEAIGQDLVIIGSRLNPSTPEVPIGRELQRIVRQLECPVLLVRPKHLAPIQPARHLAANGRGA